MLIGQDAHHMQKAHCVSIMCQPNVQDAIVVYELARLLSIILMSETMAQHLLTFVIMGISKHTQASESTNKRSQSIC